MEFKEYTMEQALEIIGETQVLLEEIQINLAWHSDGEPGYPKQETYLMEAYMGRSGGYTSELYKAITELYNKVYPK
jgi:hypothetical protein